MAPNYKLSYFNARGGAEPIRIMFALAEVEYEDHRFSGEEWPTIKPNTPFGQVPVLTVGEKRLAQSKAIYRFIAREYGFFGSNSVEAALIDMVTEICDELVVEMFQIFKESDPERKAERKKKLIDVEVPRVMTNLEKCLKRNGGNGWFVGEKLSLADIIFWTVHERLVENAVAEDYIDRFPILKALTERFKNHEGIAKWFEKRPVTEH